MVINFQGPWKGEPSGWARTIFYKETVGKQQKFKNWMGLNSLHRRVGGVICRYMFREWTLQI